ncbi:hypothetical protein [Caldiplasma sukawensis]
MTKMICIRVDDELYESLIKSTDSISEFCRNAIQDQIKKLSREKKVEAVLEDASSVKNIIKI